MPSAQGLFHKAIAQSATPMISNVRSADFSMKHAAALLARFDLNSSTVAKLHDIPADTLQRAFFETYVNVEKVEGTTGDNIGPYVDGDIVLQTPFNPAAPSISSRVPMLIGHTLNEGASIFNPARERMTESELQSALEKEHQSRAAVILTALRRIYPNAKPTELYGHAGPGATTLRYRVDAIAQAVRKTAQNDASVYLYTFAWKTPILDGRPRAFHRSEIAFVFDNTDRCAHLTGGTDEARLMAAKISSAWIEFARTGNPNHRGLPKWPAFTSTKVPTMIFDNKCEVLYDHDREARIAFQHSQ
jgi:para-nitrobenzyl esterase